MKRISLLILSLFALTSVTAFGLCTNHHSEFALNRNQDSSLTIRNTIPAYFPLSFFKERNSYVGSDTFLVTWYSRQLYALNEPVLFSLKSENEVYRFTWLRTFDNPIAIRMEKRDDTYKLYWKVCDGAGGYEPGNLIIDETTDTSVPTVILDNGSYLEFKDGYHIFRSSSSSPGIRTISGYMQLDLNGSIIEQHFEHSYEVK